MAAGESPSALARELGMRAKLLYEWKAAGKGSDNKVRAPQPVRPDKQELAIAKLKERISELERLAGRQAADLDFFAAALRSFKEARPNSGASSGKGSTR